MTCLRSDGKCMAKAPGSSRSKFELMFEKVQAYPSFLVYRRLKESNFSFLLNIEITSCCWAEVCGSGHASFAPEWKILSHFPKSAEQVTCLVFLYPLSGQEKSWGIWENFTVSLVSILSRHLKFLAASSCSHFFSLPAAFPEQKRSNHRVVWSKAIWYSLAGGLLSIDTHIYRNACSHIK